MSTPNPYAKYVADTTSADADNPYAKYASAAPVAAEPPKPKRSLVQAMNDNVVEAANAAAGTASAVGNFLRPGNKLSSAIDEHFIKAGEATQSDAVKAEKQRYADEMQNAQGVGDEIGATLGYVARNPLLAASQAAGSFAGPGLAVKGASKLASAAGLGAKGSSRAGLAAGAAMGAAGAGGDAAGTAYELSREGGATDEEAVAAARGASVIPAAIGAAGGLVGAERLVAGAGGFKGGLVSRALKTAGVEGAQEAVEEGVTQYEGQRAAVPFNPELDPMKGVAGAATMGAVLGGATGAGVSALTGQNQTARKPSEDLGLNPNTGPLSKVAASAVDEGRAVTPVQPAAPEDALSMAPDTAPQQPQGPTVQEWYAALPDQARRQVDQLLAEIDDPRTPAGVKRFREDELRQIFDANPMPQEQSMDIPAEDQYAMRPIVRGFDPATGLAPEQPLGLVDSQPQYEGGIDFEQPSQERPSSLVDLAAWYERSDQTGSQAASPLEELQQQVRQNTAYTDNTQVQAARRAVEDAWLALNAGESNGPAAPGRAQGIDAMPADTTAETDARVRAGRVSSGVRNAFDTNPTSTLAVIQHVNKALRNIGEQTLTSPEIARIRRLADARAAFAGLNQPASLPADRGQQLPAVDTMADNSAMEALIPERRPAAPQPIATEQGRPNGSPSLIDNAPQTAAPNPTQSQALAPALPQSTGVVNVTEATQTQQAGAQPQAQADAATQSEGQIAQATAVQEVSANPVEAPTSTQSIRDLAQRFRDRHSKSGADTERTFAAVLDGFARDIESGKRTMESVQPALVRYKELSAQPLKTKQPEEKSEVYAINPEDMAEVGSAESREPQAIAAAKPTTAVTAASRIEDVGEKSGGAREEVQETPKNKNSKSEESYARSTTKAPLERFDRQKKEAFERLKRVREGVKNGAVNRLELIKAENTHRDLVREVAAIKSYMPQFSRTDRQIATKPSAIQLRRGMVQRTVNSLTGAWTQRPSVTVVDSMSDPRVPERVREADQAQRSQGAMGEPEGFWFEGKVYLVASALPSSVDAARVLYHEVLGHHGLKGHFGEQLDKVLGQVAKMRSKDVQAKAEEYGLDMGNPDHVVYAAEEVLAEMAQTRPDLDFVQRAISAIRNFLREHVPGFKSLELTDADIVQGYLLPARGWVERGAGDGVRRESMDLAFSRDAQEGEEALRMLASAARSAGNKNTTLVLGPVMEETVVALQREGVPVEVGYRHTTDMYAVRHALSRHSDEKAEAKQGQLPLGEKDIAAIAQAIAAPDAWILGAKTPRGQDIIGNLKRMPDGTVLYLEEVRSGRKALAMTSMRKYPGTTDFETIKNRIVPSYAHSDTGDVRIVYPDSAFVKSGASSDSPRFSRSQPAEAIRSSMGDMTPAQERAYLAVAGFDKAPTLKERFDSFKANMGLRMKQALVDQFAPIAQVDQNAYMLARMSKGSDGTLEAALMYGRPFLRDGVPDVDIKEGGFAKVLAGLQGEHDRFLMHVAAQRAESLKAQGKENLFSDQDITSLKTLNDGLMPDGTSRKQAYAKALMQLNSFNESVLRMAKESGLIDQAAYDLMKDQPYVPFYRLMEEEGGLQGPSFSKGLTNQKAWKKLKGGTEQLNADLLQNMLLNWGNLYAASARNRAALATMDAAGKMAIAYKVPSDTKGAAKVMRDGMTEHWMVEDPYLLEAISALNYQASPLMKPLAKAKQWLTLGVTVNPAFKVRSLVREVISSMAMADLGYNPAANLAKGWRLTAKDSQSYASMLAAGGVIRFGTQEQTDRARKQAAKLSGVTLDQSAGKKLWGKVKDLYAVYDEFGDRTENITRAALYDRLIAKGHSHADAAFMARDLMDFSMSGNAPIVRFLTQSVPFLNARMQGLYKLGRAAKEDPRRFATVAMAVSVASLGLMAAYADDEDWKRREDWDRDSYWWFKIGETAYRIPKPFEVGAIGTLAERTAEAMFDDEMDSKRFMERISHMVSQTFAFDPVPQAFKPLLDIYANKDSFTGRAIESQADQRLRPEDRYNERTSEVARFLGQLGLPDPAQLVKGEYTGLSPKQIDHLMRGYFSWMATASTVASDAVLRNTVVDRGESPDMRLKDMFLVGNFAESLPTGASRYVSAMYEQSRAVEQAYASYRDALASGDQEGAAAIMESDGDKIRNRKAMADATRRLAELNSQAKMVKANLKMSGEEKRERLNQIEQRRHEISQRVMGKPAT